MGRGRIFGRQPVGAVTLVEAPVSLSYARRARLVFVVVSVVLGLSSAAVLSTVRHPLSAVAIGVVVGVVVGFLAAVVVRVWPVLRALWWWAGEITIAAFIL